MEKENLTAVAHHKGVNASLIFAGVTVGIYFAIKITVLVIAYFATPIV